MNAKFSLLALLLLACGACAAVHTINAHVLGSSNVRIANCDIVSGPSRVRTQVYIENPLSQFMAVNYEYKDLPTGTWKSGGKLCNVPAGQFQNCEATVQVALGGTGNGTSEGTLLHLIATSDAAPGDTYETELSYTITHFVGDREAQFTTGLAARTVEFNESQALCLASPSCCDQTARNQIDLADQAIQRANTAIPVCDLQGAYDAIVQAEHATDNATARINACLAAGPTPTPAVTRSPAGNQTPSGTQTPAQTATPVIPPTTPTPTPTPAPSACPLGLALLFGGLGIVMVRR